MSRNYYRSPEQRRGDKIIFGVGIAILGAVLLLRQLGFLAFSLQFTWPVILIFVGLLVGVKSRFRNHGWWIMTLIGAVNLTPQFTIMGRPSEDLVWPLFIIIGGLVIAFKPHNRRCVPRGKGMKFADSENMFKNTTADSTLNIDVTFGGRKEIVTSKEFNGGVINTTFGGAEINLMQADSTAQPMVLDLKVAFGGVEIIVPAHWDVVIEVRPTFGSVEDDRMMRTANAGEEKKILILRGSVTFGSVEIKSY